MGTDFPNPICMALCSETMASLPSRCKFLSPPHKSGLALVTLVVQQHVAEVMLYKFQSLGLKGPVNSTFPLLEHCPGPPSCNEVQNGDDMKKKGPIS